MDSGRESQWGSGNKRIGSSHDGESPSIRELQSTDFSRSDSVTLNSVSAELVGLPQVTVAEYASEHQVDRSADADPTRCVALFDVKNTGNQPLRWHETKTEFIADDEYTYRKAHLSLNPAKLGPGCHTRQVIIEPGCQARMATMVEKLPSGVEIVKVLQRVNGSPGTGNQRLVFSVA